MTNTTNNLKRSTVARALAVLRVLFIFLLPWSVASPAWADDCGLQGGRPCLVTERIPSCDINLVEAAGQCVRPNCGAENQRPCSAFERSSLNLMLLTPLPAPQPCDFNLKVDGGVCVRPNCGREGQRACDVFTRLPSCDLNLIESSGQCVHPPCGRMGEAPCDLLARGPKRVCDANLIPRNGQCVRPGVPAAAGATPGQKQAAAPVSPPAGAPPPPPRNAPPPPPPRNAPPPPPPPPSAAAPPAAQAGAMEVDTDRMGGDMYGFDVAQPDPAMCQASCGYNAQCVAWTFVKPGIQGPSARCYLKNASPAPVRNTCCVSGAKSVPKTLLPRR